MKKSKKKPVIISYKKEQKKKKRQKRLKKLKKFLKFAILIAILICGLDAYLVDMFRLVPPEGLQGPYTVAWVTDGDTIVLNIDGAEESVRLIGIDTPESVHYDDTKNTPEGKIASDYTKKLLKGKKVFIETDAELRDDYDRILAYVYLDDGETMVQELLLSDGMARTLNIPPNTRYSKLFALLQKRAQWDRKGFWAEGSFDMDQ